ncbi:MAG: hypothetical protein SGPRY_003833 [Prymnesium sp.]
MGGALLSSYEEQRLANIASNERHLRELGIHKLQPPKPVSRAPAPSGAQPRRRTAIAPRERSLRLRNLDVDGSQIPEREVKPLIAPEPKRQRQSGPLDASKVTAGSTTAEDASRFFEAVGPALAQTSSEPRITETERKDGDAADASLLNDLRSLSVRDDDIAKLVPERIFSLSFHPSPTKLLAAAGDTWGRIGLWDCDQREHASSPCVVTFETHSRPVSGIRISSHRPTSLLSCSHDGCLRSLDLGGVGKSVVLCTAPEVDGETAMMHDISEADDAGSVYVCCSDGSVMFVDPRSPTARVLGRLHEKKIFTVQRSAVQPSLLATASLDRTARVWDVRQLDVKGKSIKPLCTIEHGLSVTGAHWSPVGCRLLTTCNDNTLRVFSSGTSWSRPSCIVSPSHNCKTGRYITSFQAVWAPASDSVFVCGSLRQPRGVDVYSTSEEMPVLRLQDDNQTSVTSLHCFHQSGAMAAANGSGRVMLWR